MHRPLDLPFITAGVRRELSEDVILAAELLNAGEGVPDVSMAGVPEKRRPRGKGDDQLRLEREMTTPAPETIEREQGRP